MDNLILKVQGMHCDACKALIRMEIEDLGLESHINAIELAENNIGLITLENITDEDQEKITTSINNIENYEVIE